MSFQGLISGSDCAVSSNPLSQVLKHTEGDRSLQQDRVAGPSSTRLHQLPVTSPSVANPHDVALARRFFEGNGQSSAEGAAFNITHHVPMAELARMGDVTGRGGDMGDAWLMEQQNHIRAYEQSKTQATWASEFGNSPQQLSPSGLATHNNIYSQPGFQQQPSYMSSGGIYGSTIPMAYGMNMGSNALQSYNVVSDSVKGKGKGREADFEAAFAQAAASLSSAQTEKSRIVEVDAGVTDIEEALKSTNLDDKVKDINFKSVWDQLQNSDLPPPQEDLAKWEAEFNQLMSNQRDELDMDYAGAMKEAWEGGMAGFQNTSLDGEAPLKFDSEGMPVLGEYVFEQDNRYLATSTTSPLNDAKILLAQNGSLSEAALLLEAAIQKGELGEGGYETWILLGETRNMDEREDAGMRALSEGVTRAEASGAAGVGMLSLAISFTNESYDKASHRMLLRWLRNRFPDLHVPEETVNAMANNSTWDTHTRITDLFLNIAREQHSRGIVDSDVQIGLGVLFYTNAEYDRAKDCFESALTARPDDYLLWNRLGSSLSNGSKPEEALGAYQEALRLRPTYTRAIYNVGVACLNIGAHKEAAEHFLSALTMQESTGGTSDQVWFTLRRTFLSMNRPDLADLAKPESRTNLEVFRQQGFDF